MSKPTDLPDREYEIDAVILSSGERIIVGHTDSSIVLETPFSEPIYMGVADTNLLLSALHAACSNMGE